MRGLPSIGLGVLVSVLLAAPVFGENSLPPPSEGAVASVWKLQKVEFHYFGRTSRYSCDGMSDKVRMLMTQMGVRRDMKLRTNGCEIGTIRLEGIGPGLSLEFWTPIPAPEKAAAGADTKFINARYESFTFHQDAFRNLDIGDCELVEEFVRQVMPKFTTRAVAQNISCIPYQAMGGSYRVSGEVLKAVIPPPAGDSRGGAAR